MYGSNAVPTTPFTPGCWASKHSSVLTVAGVANIASVPSIAWHQSSRGDWNGNQGLEANRATEANATAGHHRSRSDGYCDQNIRPATVRAIAGHRRCRSDGASSQVMFGQFSFDQDASSRTMANVPLHHAAQLGHIESEATPDWSILPVESQAWTQFEKDLFLLSQGKYHPGKMSHRRRLPGNGREGPPGFLEVPGRVSVVVPTTSSRRQYHEQVWACFEAQNWIDKELVIVESYEKEPSDFFLQKAKLDSRLVYVCFQCPLDNDFSIGLKRNMTLHLASGEFIVNFDDDDMYASDYISKIIGTMQKRNLAALTFSSWYNFYEPWLGASRCAYYRPAMSGNLDREQLDDILYGFGFSYAHKRQPALLFPYPDLYFAEDAPFFLKLRTMYGDVKVGLMDDTEGLCMHIVHRGNTSGDEWLKGSKEVTQKQIEHLAVSGLPVFREYLKKQTSSVWHAGVLSFWQLLA